MSDLGDLEVAMRHSGRPSEVQVATLASAQYGVVAHRQLVELGFSPSAIARRLRAGRLHRIHLGVFAVGHQSVSQRGRWLAAVLACGPDALLSHSPAGTLWDLCPTGRATVDVTVPGRTRRGQSGIAVHNVRRVEAQDRTVRDGIPVTTVARTLLDLAEVVRPRELERAFEHAERLRLLDVTAIEDVCRRSRGRRGLRPLGALLAEHRDPAPATRSELERRFLDLCRTADLPRPSVNAVVAGYEVDMLWSQRRVVVELDGYAFHHTRAAFERDRARDATLQLGRYRVVRVTHRRLQCEPAAVVAILRSLLRV